MTRAAAYAGLILAVAISPALAQPPAAGETPVPSVSILDSGALPFSTAELTQALLARLFPSGSTRAARVRVEPAGAGMVTVEVGERSRVVPIGDRSGAAAARVVALVIAELLSDRGDAPSEPTDAAPAPPAVNEAATLTEAPAAAVVARSPGESHGPSPAAPPRLSATGGLARGMGSEEMFAGTLDADVSVSIGDGAFRLAPSAGLVWMPTRNEGTFGQVSYSAAMVRLLAGGSFGLVEVFGGPFLAPYQIKGATNHDGILFGAEALARLAAPLSRRARLVVAARAHGYGNRVRALWVDGSAYATPRVELSLGVGVAWDWAP